MKSLLQQVQPPQPTNSDCGDSKFLPNQQEEHQQQQQQQPHHQTQHQQQQLSSIANFDDINDPFAENRAKKAAKRDKFLGRERQQQQLEQLRALVSAPQPPPSASSSANAGGTEQNVESARAGANSFGGWGVKVTGASFFCKAADEAATQWQVTFHLR